MGCFADGQTATLESGHQVPIESIRVGDKILTASTTTSTPIPMPTFSPVTWIMVHKTPKQIISFALQTADGTQGLVF